ncbi:ECF-type sigma factor [Dokdonella immobilis]|uniref:RNA polymerase, sigma subunit, ECF family n=1 Tax=Dokdonella immobilis TaxID=578942 RepID=A0A1I4ZZ63_9GAMM|nr:ECF-type sigma factor [Dokdonella immobilis]SFN55403.1 RNA polymerase, sigma subunit, ECF family [Dokdonella immobilis]
MDDSGAITGLLRRMSAGDAQAQADLVPLVYAQLHALAARYLRGERAAHTLSPTALVNEAWLRLANEAGVSPADRRDYFALAARRMRQVLVDHARRRAAAKRDGGQRESAITLSSLATPRDGGEVDTLALDQALQRLEALDARKVRVVELRYFAGLTMDEVADALDISRATAQRDWEVARSFLFQALQ